MCGNMCGNMCGAFMVIIAYTCNNRLICILFIMYTMCCPTITLYTYWKSNSNKVTFIICLLEEVSKFP